MNAKVPKTDGDGLVHGRRYSKEEDEMLKKAVFCYIKEHGLGEAGLEMVMNCKKHHRIRNVWSEIKEAALPWRPPMSLRDRAHVLFERSNDHFYTPEERELIESFHEQHGPRWAVLAKALGKHRKHVKDQWRKIRARKKVTGRWSQEEYQKLFDLVNLDLQLKSGQAKISKHGMLRDNIPWVAISDSLGTRSEFCCFKKWYEQLTSSMVAEGEWRDSDDYCMLGALCGLDASNSEDVEWDKLLENRSGEVCRRRWKHMVSHLGEHRNKSFSEQVDILSRRYRPELHGESVTYENRPYDC